MDIIITDLNEPEKSYNNLILKTEPEKVLVPDIFKFNY